MSKTMTEIEIRADERKRIANLLLSDLDVISGFAADKRTTVQLICHLIRWHSTSHRSLAEDYSKEHVA